MGRIIGIDPGDKNIGLALSDPSGTIANPLAVLAHTSRQLDAAAIAQLATDHGALRIIVGQALDMDGKPGPQGRKAARLAGAIRTQTHIPVELWDESGSTQAARSARLALGTTRRKRGGHLDDLAATYMLQTYLDAHQPGGKEAG